MSLPMVWEVAHPYPEVLRGVIPEDAFAADLASVVSGKAPKAYRDPEEFFEKTFMTKSLDGLVRAVVGRVSGRSVGEPAVFRLETVFGGGKTHALLVLYHVFNGPDVAKHHIRTVLRNLGLTSIPKTRMAVLAGTAFDPISGSRHDEHVTWTLWGEIAYQLGGAKLYSEFEESDKKRVPPGTRKLAELFEEPTVLLVDEISEYLSKTSGIPVGDTTLAELTVSFIHELTQAVAASENSILVITLPSEADPYRRYTREVVEALEAVRKVTGRISAIYVPIGAEEIYDVVRIRFFERVGKEAQDVVKDFAAYYQAAVGQFPSKTAEPGYMDKLSRSYPIHPELIDILYERVSTIPEFQRTRGVLRLLASIVNRVYASKPTDAYMIMPGHIDLAHSKILDELTIRLGRREYQPAVTSDVASKDGNAKAQRIDRDLSAIGIGGDLATKLATSIFLYSLIGVARAEPPGATEQQLALGIAYPGFNARQIPDVLKRLMDDLWYIYESAGQYSLRTAPNINKVIEEFEDSVRPDEARSEIEALIEERLEHSFFKKDDLYVWPRDHTEVADGSDPKLIIVDHGITSAKGPQDFMGERLPEHLAHVADIYDRSGDHYRQYKNTIFFLVADESGVNRLVDNARVKVAVTKVRNSKDIVDKLTKDQKAFLDSKYSGAASNLEMSLLQAYRYIVYPAPKGRLGFVSLSVEEMARREKRLTRLVYERLKAEGKIIAEKLSPDVILEKCWVPEGRTFIPTQEVYEAFLRYPDLPYVQNEGIVLNSIKDGVEAEKFGYSGRPLESLEQAPGGPFWFGTFREEIITSDVEISPSAYLISPDSAGKIVELIKLTKKPPVLCPVCGESFKDDATLTGHIVERHPDYTKPKGVSINISFDRGELVAARLLDRVKSARNAGATVTNQLDITLRGGIESVIAASTLGTMLSALGEAEVQLKSAKFESSIEKLGSLEVIASGTQAVIQPIKSVMEAVKASFKVFSGSITLEAKAIGKPIDLRVLEDLSKVIKGYRDIDFSLSFEASPS